MLLVAEIGLNYEGNFDLAYELIAQASRSGADIAKFQLGRHSDPGDINYIDPGMAHQLKEWCQWWEIEFMASICSEEAMETAMLIDPDRFKIASRTVVENPRLVEWVLAEDKETFISLGQWEDQAFPYGSPSDKIRYVYCRSRYPTYPRDLEAMPRRFGPEGYYGYSDHMHGIEGCLLAISRGAEFVETHFTLDRTILSPHGDHVLSTTPRQMKQLDEVGRPLGRLADAVDGQRQAPGGAF